MAYIYKLLPIIYSNLLLITPILYLILSVLALLFYQALLVSLLEIINSINSYSIILNLTQSLRISTGGRESLSNIVVKNIKDLNIYNRKLFKDKKTYFNITATLTTHTPIIRTKGIRFYIVSLITYL